MRRHALVLVCAMGVGCGSTKATPAPAPVPPAPRAWPCALAADQGREHGFRMALQATLERAATGGPAALADLFAEPPGALADLSGLASRRDPVRADTLVACPDATFLLGRGIVTDLVLGLRTAIERGDVEDDGLRAVVLRGAYADWSDGWRIHQTPPRDAFAGMRVLATHADVWLSLDRRWATVEVELVARVDGDDRLVLAAPPLEAPVADADATVHGGFRLVDATVDGDPADVVLGTGGYLVIGGVGRRLARVALRYEGPLPLVGENQVERAVLELHRWLPWVPYAAPAPLALTVHHPDGEALVTSLEPVDGAAPVDADGWRTERLAGAVDRDPSLLLVADAPTGGVWDDGRGSRLTVAATPPVRLDDCAPAFERVVEALAPLGPVGRVRLVAVPAVFGRHGRRVGDLVVILRDKLVDLCTRVGRDTPLAVRRRRDAALALVAHELAHGWFGRAVRAADDEASAWYEAAAEYASSWAIDDDAAAVLRRGWLDDYDEQAERDQLAMAERVPTTGALRDALSYAKGALLFAALEDELGRDRVAAVLRQLVARRRGGIGSWLDVVAATQEVAGSAAAGWLRAWLTATGAPHLEVADARVVDGRVRLAIVQDASPPFAARVGVGVFRGDRLLAYARVPLSGSRTSVVLDAPTGADRVAVDPFARLPHTGAAEVALARSPLR